jgi:cell division protein ZapE
MAAASAELRSRYERQLAQRGFQADPGQLAAVARLEDLRTRLLGARAPRLRLPEWLRTLGARRGPPVTGLFLWGGVGVGKTWLMDLFYASLPFGERRRRHFHRFMYEVHHELAQLRNVRAPLERVAARIARAARVLCFDELMVADIADAMIVGGLFEALFRHGVTLVATANVPPRELYRDGLQRERFVPAIELLEQHLEVLHLEGNIDYRLRKLARAGTYLPAGAPDTAARLQSLFDSLATETAQRGGALQIEERALAVLRSSAGIAWFDFQALCAGPRSQDDYIGIAREFPTIMVSDVPVLDAAHDDEARRFIALIDELYDRNVKLIVSAAAAPGGLYVGQRLGAQFARTVSRLTEMQSAEYLAREHLP